MEGFLDVWPCALTHVRRACHTALLALGQEGLPPCFPGAVGAPEKKLIHAHVRAPGRRRHPGGRVGSAQP